MSSLSKDIRHSYRALVRTPSFTLAAVCALALGIGANTAIFSVVKGVLLHALPYQDEDEVVMIWGANTSADSTSRVGISAGDFLDFRADPNLPFEEIAAISNNSLRITSFDRPLVPLTQTVTANFFDVLGVEPHLGRTFIEGEDEVGRDRVVVLSYAIWQRALGGDAEAVGTSILLDHEAYDVVGVLRPDFFSVHRFNVQPDLFVPMPLAGRENERNQRNLITYGRLRAGLDVEAAEASMSVIAERLALEFPDTNEGWGVRVVTIQQEAVGSFRPTLVLLLAAVGFVLLIACANVANLMLARTSERTRELALRRALGASEWRLTRELLVESLVLSLVSGSLGLGVAAFSLDPLLALVPAATAVPFLDDVSLDQGVLWFTLVLSAGTGILFGLAPLRMVSREDATSLNQGRSNSATPSSRRFGSFLVVSEVTLALVLTLGAALMVQSFHNLKSFDAGFDAERLLKLRTSLRGEAFFEPAARTAHFQELKERLAVLPGVEGASAVSFDPPIGVFRAAVLTIGGEPSEPGNEPSGTARVVLPDYFETLGIPILFGRSIHERDRADSLPVAIINENLASEYFGSRDPIGETLVIEAAAQGELIGERRPRRIVGVVGNVRSAGTNPVPIPVVYVPHTQAPVFVMSFLVRVRRDLEPSSLARVAEQTAWEMGGDINVYGVAPVTQSISDQEWSSDVATLLLGLFASLALLMGASGIYAVVSYAVEKRRHEIGVRMALGAKRSTVVAMILASGLRLTVLGVVVGTVLSLFTADLLRSLLFGISTNDLPTIVAVSLLLLTASTLACAVPALRASKVDPILALKD